MNAWLLFLPGWPATSIGRLRLLQRCWSAQEAVLVVLAIDRRETYRFLNSLMDSSVTRKALGVGLALSHSNSTNRRTDLVFQLASGLGNGPSISVGARPFDVR